MFTIAEFSTVNNIDCPIESYKATGLVSGISADPACPVIADTSVACRSIIIDKSKVKTYRIKFKIKARGGSERDSSPIVVSVACASSVKVLPPLKPT